MDTIRSEWRFRITLGVEGGYRSLHEIILTNRDRYRRLLALHRRELIKAGVDDLQPGDSFFFVEYQEDDDRLPVILSEVAEEGWKPVFHLRIQDLAREKLFTIRKMGGGDPREERSAEFLIGMPVVLGGWVEKIDAPDIAMARCDASEAAKGSQVISLPGNCPILSGWSDEAMAAFQAAGLKGAVFHPLHWQAAPKRRIWHPSWLGSEVSMPPNLVPRVAGGVVITDNDTWCTTKLARAGFDDDARVDYRLKYRRSEIRHLADVDVATTWEVGPWDGLRMPSHHLFSQRFRRWAIKQGYKFRWRQVVIVEE